MVKTGAMIYQLGKWDTGFKINGAAVDTNWHHAVFTYDGTTLRAYFDGAADGTDATGTYNASSQGLYLGVGNLDSETYNFSGIIGETIVWNRVLSAQEAYDLYMMHAGNNTSE